jgi:arylsulfatase A-like enzyme
MSRPVRHPAETTSNRTYPLGMPPKQPTLACGDAAAEPVDPGTLLSRRRVLKGSSAVAAGLALAGCHHVAEKQALQTQTPGTTTTPLPPAPRPNIILVLADDIGFSDIGCFGGEIATPNLDRLAGQGWRLTEMHNNPRCCPSRASLLTGLYPTQAGVGCMTQDQGTPAYQGYLNETCVTLGEVLGAAGYRTAIAGKWHVAPPRRLDQWPASRGFEESFCNYGGGTHFDCRRYVNGRVLGDSHDPHFYLTYAVTNRAVANIEKFAAGPDPFFVYAAYHAPHFPLQAPAGPIEQYRGKYAMGWDSLRVQRWEKAKARGVIDPAWDLPGPASETTRWASAVDKDWQQSRMEVYATQITLMDEGVGKIVDTVERLGIAEDTLILFLGDNGACAKNVAVTAKGGGAITRDGLPLEIGNSPFVRPGPSNTFESYGIDWANASNSPFRKFKVWTEEGGISTPCVAWWPGTLKSGSTDHSLTHVMDLMPTFAELGGATYPTSHAGNEIQPVEGESFAGLLTGEVGPSGWTRKETLFWEHLGHRAARQGDWKIVANNPTGQFLLFNMATDRTETVNVAQQFPGKLEELTTAWEAWKVRTGVRTWNRVTQYRPT